jgi:hypothetical protein
MCNLFCWGRQSVAARRTPWQIIWIMRRDVGAATECHPYKEVARKLKNTAQSCFQTQAPSKFLDTVFKRTLFYLAFFAPFLRVVLFFFGYVPPDFFPDFFLVPALLAIEHFSFVYLYGQSEPTQSWSQAQFGSTVPRVVIGIYIGVKG